MFYKKIAFLFLLLSSSFAVFSQTKNYEWQVGVGASITQFADKDTGFIGDKHQLQIPRFNITAPITDNLSLDTAVSVNTFDFDSAFITNSAFYFSVDVTARYHIEATEWFFPYVFAGGSLVDSSYSISPTIDAGVGATLWMNNLVGFNLQTYYKYSLESSESMRSHLQFTGGLVFAIDMFDLLWFGRSGKVCF